MDMPTSSRLPLPGPEYRVDGVSYCINPNCRQTQALTEGEICQHCGTPLLVNGKYRLVRSLRAMNPLATTDIFEVESWPDRLPKVIKILRDSDPQAIEHFEREALALQWLDHPGVPKVELGDEFTVEIPATGQCLRCLVMEKIDGENLETWVSQHGPIDQKTAIGWLKQLLEILEIIHDNQFFHRDIKPSNIMRRPNGQLVLIDFGSVRTMTNTYVASVHAREVTTSLSVGYTPQEQLDGQAVPQSDFFALGRTFVYLLTGIHPGEIPYQTANARLLWRDKAPQVSTALKDLIDELMALKPSERPASAAEVYRHLSANQLRLTDARLIVNSRKFKFAATLLLALGLGTLGVYRVASPLMSERYARSGTEALMAGELDEAYQLYQKAQRHNPNDVRIYNNLALVCQEKQDRICAEAMYMKALELNPDNATARYNLGELYEDIGDLERAETQYRLAMLSDERSIAALARNNLAGINILNGHFVSAVSLASEGLALAELDQHKATLYKNRGWAYYLQNNYEQAIADLEASIQLLPQQADAYCLLAQVWEAKEMETNVSDLWHKCLENQSPRENLEVKVWQNQARKSLNIQE